jgi:hypothetical protein
LLFCIKPLSLIAKPISQARSEWFQILWLDESSRSEVASWVLRWVEKSFKVLYYTTHHEEKRLTITCERNQSTLHRKVVGFLRELRNFLPQGMLTGWAGMGL